jgi:hypothetical protein
MLSGGEARQVSRLLVIRSTRTNREIVRAHAATFATVYPGDSPAAREALTGTDSWPGPSILWARVDGGVAELLRRRPPGTDFSNQLVSASDLAPR